MLKISGRSNNTKIQVPVHPWTIPPGHSGYQTGGVRVVGGTQYTKPNGHSDHDGSE